MVYSLRLTGSRTKSLELQSYLIVAFLSLPSLLSFLSNYNIPSFVLNITIAIILYIPLVFGVINGTIKINLLCFLLFLIAFVYVICCFKGLVDFREVYNSETNGVSARILTFTSSIFGLLFFGIRYCINNLKKGMLIAAYINLVICIFRFFFVTIRGNEFVNNGYDMNFGYTLLFPLLCFLVFYFLNKKKTYLLISIICFLFVLFFGSRGPILCVAIFLILYFLFVYLKKATSDKKISIIIIISIIVLFTVAIYKFVIPLLDLSFLPRSILYVINSDYFSTATDSGRQIILQDLSPYLSNAPFFGYGLLADQGFLGVGKYSHNIFYEMIITFGRVPGILMLVLIALLSLRVFFKKNVSLEAKLIFIMFWSFSFGRLLVSNSFWYETFFWCCIAMGIVIVSKRGTFLNERK